MASFHSSEQNETQTTPASLQSYHTPSSHTPGTPQTFDALSYDKLDKLLQRDGDDIIANGLSSCITFARMGVPQLAIAEIPALRKELLTSRWISVAHLEAVYEIANSLDLLDLHKLLTDFFIQRGLHLQSAGLAVPGQLSVDHGHEADGSSVCKAEDISQGHVAERFKQVRHPLMSSIAEVAGAHAEQSRFSPSGSSSDESGSDDDQAGRQRSTSTQSNLIVMSHLTASPGSAGNPRRRGRNSSPASLSGAVSPEAATDGTKVNLSPSLSPPQRRLKASEQNEMHVRQRTKSWLVPGGAAYARSISQRTLFRWRQELQVALASVDATVQAELGLNPAHERSSGFRIVDEGNVDSPRRRASELAAPGTLSGKFATSQALLAQTQFGGTPASDFLEKSLNAHDDTCASCTTWQLKYNLLRSESAEQIAQLQNAIEQLGEQISAHRIHGLSTTSTHGSMSPSSPPAPPIQRSVSPENQVPALHAPPPSARHRSRFSRLTVLSAPTSQGSAASTQELPSEGSEASTDSAAHAAELKAYQNKLKQQKHSFIAREKRWKDLTAKLTSRLESKTHEVRALKGQLNALRRDGGLD